MSNDGNRRDKILNLLGIARKGRHLVAGDAASAATDGKKAKFLVVAADASERTADRFIQAAKKSGVPFTVDFTKAELAKAIGNDGLAAAVAVTDAGFARALSKIIAD